MSLVYSHIYQWLGEGIVPDSSISVSFSSIEILLQPEFPKENNLARLKFVPLNPVILEDTMGITKTDEALIGSSPKPNDSAQALCEGGKGSI